MIPNTKKVRQKSPGSRKINSLLYSLLCKINTHGKPVLSHSPHNIVSFLPILMSGLAVFSKGSTVSKPIYCTCSVHKT